MCLSPITIKNPHRQHQTMCHECGESFVLPARFKSHREYIKVPCGHCADCRNTYLSSLLQRALCEHLTSYMFFVTLTYDNHHIPFLILPNGKTVFYSDYRHIQNLFKRFRDNTSLNREFRYLAVNEYGDTYNRPHWHLLLFVAKQPDDNEYTPNYIERILFDELKQYYAVNIGTRKHPIYEPLFTYKIKHTPQGLKTNYFVKYVDCSFDHLGHNLDITASKTILYLLSYVNKPSRFDKQIEIYLQDYQDDPILVKKLRHKLRCSVHYSKHFGDGFTVTGQKNIVKPISLKSSPNVSYFSELRSNYPSDFEEFFLKHRDEYNSLKQFLDSYPFNSFFTLAELYESFDNSSFHLFCLAQIYYPHTINNIVEKCYRHYLTPTISYEHNFLANKCSYQLTNVKTTTPTSGVVSDYVRSSVESGLINKVPFLPFFIPADIPRYVPLCNYLKQRYTLLSDFENLLNTLGLSDYDAYLNNFDQCLRTSIQREHIRKSNEIKHDSSENPICIIQKHCLSLYQQKGETLFDILFHK